MFDIVGTKIELSADSLAIPPFRDLYDSIEDKELALRYIEYIIWMHRYNSPYQAIPVSDRERVIKKDIFKDSDHIIPANVKVLEGRYKNEFLNTFSMRYLQSQRNALESVMVYLNSVTPEDMTDSKVKNITASAEKAGGVLRSLNEIEDAVVTIIHG